MNLRTIALIILLFPFSTFSQNATIVGKVTDASSEESLYGVTVNLDSATGVITDFSGEFEIQASVGKHTITFSYVSLRDSTFMIELKNGEIRTINVSLQSKTHEVGTVVIGTSKYKKPIEEETVSIEVLTADDLIKKNSVKVSDAVEHVPGLSVIDGQASIRGGSGYAYGAGSRVMLVVDDQPLLTADRNDIKWNFVPIENIEQIEIIKGASSVQYGSSALNGVIHVRTGYAKSKPETSFSTFFTAYDQPKDVRRIWWGDNKPYATGLFFCHKQKFNRFDLVFGGNLYSSQSWLKGEYENRGRLSFKTRYRTKNNRINYGLNGNMMYQDARFFFFWENDSSGAYTPFNGEATIIDLKYLWITLDPFLTFFDGRGNKHSFKSRYYKTNDISDSDWKPSTNLFSMDYQFQKAFSNNMTLTTGFSGSQYFVYDDALSGGHDGNFGAVFVQADKKFQNLTVAAGLRDEIFRLDELVETSNPVGRIGINYSPGEKIFYRASFGQGFRFPSPTERFVTYNIDLIHIYPNPELIAESGWSAEIGAKRTVRISNWYGYFDVAAFWTQFRNMTEFTFGQWSDDTSPENFFGLGFKSLNVNSARIAGVEVSSSGTGNIGDVKMNLLAGYTYNYPVDLNEDTTLRQVDHYLKNFANGFGKIDTTYLFGMLKYRFRHMVKFDCDAEWKNIYLGGSVRYYSFMDRIDAIFEEFIPGVKSYRRNHPNGDVVLDLRLAFQLTKTGRISLLVNNVLNDDFVIRAAKPESPRNFTLQYVFNF